eukprot:GFUD01124492.1.p1 GENE.GFUD01124492.1~~GFUD01124492.1.p1  ORF type:complete len:104 (-),score=16.37 GFUD01124492.1:117-428(-)
MKIIFCCILAIAIASPMPRGSGSGSETYDYGTEPGSFTIAQTSPMPSGSGSGSDNSTGSEASELGRSGVNELGTDDYGTGSEDNEFITYDSNEEQFYNFTYLI